VECALSKQAECGVLKAASEIADVRVDCSRIREWSAVEPNVNLALGAAGIGEDEIE